MTVSFRAISLDEMIQQSVTHPSRSKYIPAANAVMDGHVVVVATSRLAQAIRQYIRTARSYYGPLQSMRLDTGEYALYIPKASQPWEPRCAEVKS